MCAFGYHGCFLSSWSYNVNLLQHMTVALLVLSGFIELAAGAGNETTIVPESNPFVTDGTRELPLTCNTTAPSDSFYIWTLPGPRLCPSPATDNCTFHPRLEDDGRKANCIVLDSSFVVLGLASYDIDLQYPPPGAPSIRKASSRTEPLKQGDIITCTVTGGKPPVTNITFECQNLYHRGRQGGDRTVSTITVNTSQATADNMTCTCSAHWDPEPTLYPNTTDMEFILELTPLLPTTPSGDGLSTVERVVIAVVFNNAVALVVVIVIVVKRKMKAKKRNSCSSTGHKYHDNYALGSESEQTLQHVTAC